MKRRSFDIGLSADSAWASLAEIAKAQTIGDHRLVSDWIQVSAPRTFALTLRWEI